jgi:hypothetical protein
VHVKILPKKEQSEIAKAGGCETAAEVREDGALGWTRAGVQIQLEIDVDSSLLAMFAI